MKADLWRLASVLFICVVAGLIFGNTFFITTAGLVIYCLWQYKTLEQLLSWIRQRKDVSPPDIPGVIDEITREIDFLRINHKKRKKKLSRFLRRFQESTAALPDAVIIMGENNVIEWANENAEAYLGVHWPQDARQRISNLIRHPDLLKYIGDMHESKSDRGLELASPVNPDLHLELRIAPYGESQQLLIARDITRIYRANKMRKDFIANASHELRTPLTVISGYLESFELESESRLVVWQNQIRNMRTQTDRMRRLIEDLLKLSTLETDTQKITTDLVRVPDLISSIYEEARAVDGLIEHIFTIESDPEIWIKGSQNEIYSAFSNLVFNAVQHTPENGVIKIKWYEDVDGSACLDVIDSGEGISPEHIPRITERFYRVDKGRSREKGGTGLGLAIVKHVLARHNANLEIESNPGNGSTFRCRFDPKTVVRKSSPGNFSLTA